MMALLRRSPPLVFVAFVALAAAAMRAQAPADRPPTPTVPDAGEAAVPGVPGEPSPVLMRSLFAGFIATQALDVHSTLRAVDAGAREANGAMRWATDRPAGFIGLKAATTVATCLILDRLRRQHPKRAMFLLVGIDAAYGVIVAHNYMTAPGR